MTVTSFVARPSEASVTAVANPGNQEERLIVKYLIRKLDWLTVNVTRTCLVES